MRPLHLTLTLALSVFVACGGASQPPPTNPTPTATLSATPSAAPSATPSATPTAAPSPSPSTPPGSTACVGKVETPEGLKEVDDPELLKQALGEPGKGGLCMGKVFEAIRPVTVFRVWNQAKLDTALGRWWAFTKPLGPVEAYRTANAICPEWTPLTIYNECVLKVGAKIVVGPGQSAECKKTQYEQSATNQVFIPNDTRDKNNQKLYVERCSSGTVWP
jgi:hypothetical protein